MADKIDVLEFGNGSIVVDSGKFRGAPAVFIAKANKPGKVGESAAREQFARDLLQPNERVLTFPTEAQANAVADALCNAPPAPPPAGDWVTVPRELLESLAHTRPHSFGCMCVLCEGIDRIKAMLAAAPSPSAIGAGEMQVMIVECAKAAAAAELPPHYEWTKAERDCFKTGCNAAADAVRALAGVEGEE